LPRALVFVILEGEGRMHVVEEAVERKARVLSKGVGKIVKCMESWNLSQGMSG